MRRGFYVMENKKVEKEQKEGAKYYTLEKLNESLLQIIQNK